MRNANLKTRELDLTGRKLIDVYKDPFTCDDCTTGSEFYLDNEETVKEMYMAIVDEYMDDLYRNPNIESLGYKIRNRRDGSLIEIAYFGYDDNEDEDYQKVWLGIYTEIDGKLMLIPYSTDSVKAATYICTNH